MFGELYDCFALDLKRPLVWTPARLRAWPAACAVPASLSWSAHGLSTEDHCEQQQKHFGAVVKLKRTIKT